MEYDTSLSMMVVRLARSQKEYVQASGDSAPFQLRQVCLYVEAHPGTCQEDAATGLCLDKSLLARNVKKGLEAGLITRQASPVDTRRTELYITEKGKCFNHETVENMHAWEQRILEKMTPSERRQLEYLLGRMCL
ncbi:MAG: MarR family winged helix-turn-helix transcriptional regulator [Bulleidia sp.]